MVDELSEPAVILHDFFGDLRARSVGLLEAAFVTEHDAQAGNQERCLAGTAFKGGRIELRVRSEDLRVSPVADAGSGDAAFSFTDDFRLLRLFICAECGVWLRLSLIGEGSGFTAPELHTVGLAAAVDFDVEAGRKSVDDGSADAVQTTGCCIGTAAELTARVQLGEYDFEAREPRARLDVDRDAAAVIGHFDRAVRVHRDGDG